MRLYYYTKLHHGLSTIRDKRLKISLYDSLNDPFDFLGVSANTMKQRTDLAKLRKELSARSGIICLSETWKQPLMWGHYADSHKGMCLGFEVKAGQYTQIDYRAERPKLSDFGKKSIAELTAEDQAEIARRKFNEWSYEREWRRIVSLETRDLVDGNYYLPFGYGLSLTHVFFGSRSGITKEKIQQIAQTDDSLKIAITRPANSAFDIVINRSETKRLVPENNRVLNLSVPDDLALTHALEKAVDGMLNFTLKGMVAMSNRRLEQVRRNLDT